MTGATSATLATVARCGLVTVQDGGRRGHGAVGVPVAGPLHRERYAVAARLVGGSRGADGTVPTMELLDGSVVLDVDAPTSIAFVGPGSGRIEAVDDAQRRAEVAANVVVEVGAGRRLVVERAGRGPVYVAVGGWRPVRTLGSAATDTFGAVGGAVVQAGYVLAGVPEPASDRVGAFWRPVPYEAGPLRVVPAPEAAAGPSPTSGEWVVHAVGRSGVRLAPQGAAVPAEVAAAAPSRPVVPGTVQRTPSGELLVLGPDGGVTGGYPVVGVVASVDLPRLADLAPGDVVSMAPIEVADAVRAYEDRQARVRRAFGRPDLNG